MPRHTLFFVLLLAATSLHAQDSLKRYSLPQLDSIIVQLEQSRRVHLLLPYARTALQRIQTASPPDDTLRAQALYRVGYAYRALQKMDSSEWYLQKALDIQQQKQNPSKALAMTLLQLAVLNANKGDYRRAEEGFVQALPLMEQTAGRVSLPYAGALNGAGNLYVSMGRYPEAKASYLQSLELRRQLADTLSLDYVALLTNLGRVYGYMSDMEKNEELVLKSLEVLRSQNQTQHAYYFNSLNALGLIYGKRGMHERAEAIFVENLQLSREIFGPLHPNHAACLQNLGNTYAYQKKYAKAEQCFLEAMDIEAQTIGIKHVDYPGTLINMSSLYDDMGLYDKALDWGLKAWEALRQNIGDKHPYAVLILQNIGSSCMKLGEYDKAERFYLQSLDVSRLHQSEQHPERLHLLALLARLALKTNRPERARAYLQPALENNSGLYGVSLFPLSAASKDSLSRAAYVSVDDADEALSVLFDLNAGSPEQQLLVSELAMDILESSQDAVEDEEDRLRFLQNSASWLSRALAVLPLNEQPERAFALAERNKSVLLRQATRTERIYSFGVLPDSLMQTEKRLSAEYDKIKAVLGEQHPPAQMDSLRQALLAAALEIDDFQKRLKNEYPQYYALKHQRQTPSADSIRASLPPDALLLEYVLTNSALYLFALSSGNMRCLVQTIDSDSLFARIRRLQRNLSDYDYIQKNANNAYSEYTSEAYALYQLLVEPALGNPADGNIKHLIVVPDGILGHIPFEALLRQAAPAAPTPYSELPYLVRDYKISYNYSAALWKDNMQYRQTRHNGRLLAMVADYEKNALPASRLPVYRQMREQLQPLPAAKREVESLAEHFNGTFLFDTAATERAFKRQAADFAVVHLAMHGMLDRKSPVLSSLAFTEDGDSVENNFLQAYEISKMRLNADLVVLSACETGYGRFEQGNGTASLARAFMYAGVPALVVSLWEVNDMGTAQIMTSFYRELSDGQDKACALQRAKIDYLSQAKGLSAHPAFWSPFIVVGDHNPVRLTGNAALRTWLPASLAALGIVLLVLFWLKRRR